MILSAGPLRVRRLNEPDAPLLARWLSGPRVLEFYGGRGRPHDLAMVRRAFLGQACSSETRGIGTHLVKAAAGCLFAAHGAERVVVDPQAEKARAIRCYEKAGFHKVRLLVAHEWSIRKAGRCGR